MNSASLQFTPYVLPVLGAALLLFILSLYIGWQQRRPLSTTPETWIFLNLVLLTGWWCITYAAELLSTRAASILFWTRLEWISIALLPVAWLLFALSYTGRIERATPRLIGPLLILPIIMIGLAWTTPAHALLYVNPGITTDGPFVAFSAQRGPAYFVHVLYAYGLVGIATWFIFRHWWRSRGQARRLTLFVLIGALLPFVSNAIYQVAIVRGRPFLIDPTMLVFAISAILFSWGWFRLQLSDLLPDLPLPAAAPTERGEDATDLTQSTQGRTLNLVSLGLSVLLFLALIPTLTLLLRVGPDWPLMLAYLGLYLLVLLVAFWRSVTYRLRSFGLVMVYLGLMALDLRISGLTPVLGLFLLAYFAFVAILLRGRAVAVALLLGGVTLAAVAPVEGPAFQRDLFSLLYLLFSAAMTGGLLLVALVMLRRDSRTLLRRSRQLARELELEREQLEVRVIERTRALETSAAISRQLSTILDQSQLVNEVVEQLRLAFAYYHVHVYLWDEEAGALRMAGGTGEAGQTMRSAGHMLAPGQGLVGRAFFTRAPVIVPDVRQDAGWLPNRLLPSTRAEIAVPIMYGDQVLGVLDTQDSDVGGLGQGDSQLLQTVAGQLAVALRNARLLAQIQREAEQTALINQENLRLREQAETALHEARQREKELALVNQVVTSIAATADLKDSLQLIVDQLAAATSIGQVGVAILNDDHTALTVLADRSEQLNAESAVGFVIPLENNPATQQAIRERKPVIVHDATTSPLTASAHEVLRQRGVKTILILPLVVGNEVIGTVGLDVVEEGIELTDEQLRLAETIVYQGASAIQRTQLFEQARDRSRQLERLSRIEADLSLATTEDEILYPLATDLFAGAREASSSPGTLNLEYGTSSGPSMSLTYLSTRGSDGALLAECVSSWPPAEGGAIRRPAAVTPLRDLPLSELWLDRPRDLLTIQDSRSDPRLDDAMRAQAAREGWRALALLPLRRGGQWQGFFSIVWPEPHALSADETFILQRLHEPLAATVAGRRAYLAQRGALAQTEALYNVSARLNMAQSYDDILAVIRQHTELGHAADALHFVHFDQPWLPDQPPQAVTVLAQWSRDGGEAPAAGPRWQFDEYPALRLLRADRPTVFADIINDPRLDRPTRAALAAGTSVPPSANGAGAEPGSLVALAAASGGARSAVFAPLVVGGKWIGYVSLFYQRQARSFAEDEIDSLAGLIGQVAVAAQTIVLLEQTQRALADQARLAAQLRAVSEVAVVATATLDVDQLLTAAAELTRESFDLYHAHIYLIDEAEGALVLRAGAGEVGRRMVSEGWRIPLAANSIVARAARERDTIVVADTRHSADFLPNPLLPDTLSEMAVPLIVGERLLGVLDVQADKPERFDAYHVLAHRILAAQLAVAAQNAYYFAEQLHTAEKLRELDRLKTDFLAHMSHELRTPLNSIIGFAEVMLIGLDGELTERMAEDLQLIHSSGHHLREIIGDILDMSKIEAGRLELTYEPFDIEQVTSKLLATAAPQAESKGLELTLDIDPSVGQLMADSTRVQQVLWNIVGNAIKFTDRGRVAVSIRQDDEDVLFTVEDTGIGIAPEHLPRIFDHFHQVDAGWRGSTSGTGLGLAISRSLVELHGGHIWAESELGRGSTFRFTIPCCPPERM